MTGDKINPNLPSEGLTFEYKSMMLSSRELARTMTAFANTQGGKIIIGTTVSCSIVVDTAVVTKSIITLTLDC
jgi:predicted HTH transcriptional regulator